MAEVQHRRRVRNRRHRQIDAGKAAQCLAIVERVLQGLVGQPVPLLQKVDPQHPLQPNRRPAAFALRVERPQTFNQPRPWHHFFHLGQKAVPPRLLFLPGVFRLRKAALPLHRSPQPTGRFYRSEHTSRGPFFSVSLAACLDTIAFALARNDSFLSIAVYKWTSKLIASRQPCFKIGDSLLSEVLICVLDILPSSSRSTSTSGCGKARSFVRTPLI